METHYENYYCSADEREDRQRILDLIHGAYNPLNWEQLEVMLNDFQSRFERTASDLRILEGWGARFEAEMSLLGLHSVIMSLVRWTTYDAIAHTIEELDN